MSYLDKIKKICIKHKENCTGCPLYKLINGKYEECLFMHIPGFWKIDKIKKQLNEVKK